MKQELDAIMQKYGADYLWISGAAQHNPNMVYFTGDPLSPPACGG